jgi:cation:H+ antiporter
MVAITLFIAGLALLVIGAELVVRGAAQVAIALGISPMVIGLTIVSVGTSLPELAVGIVAGAAGEGALAVGNIAGTNVLNMLFILGLSALVRPLPLQLQVFKLELPVIVLAAAAMTLLSWDGVLSRTDAAVMLLMGVLYTVALVMMTRSASQAAKREYQEEYAPEAALRSRPSWQRRAVYTAVLLGGIVFTVVGAELLVRGAVSIATALGVSSTIIGLTIVAIGTSAPELVTTIVSTIKDDRDVAVGNLLGSSIYNILFILSGACLATPGGFPVEPQLLWFDIPLMAGVAIGAIPVFVTGKRVSRFEGGLGVGIYLAYIVWLVTLRT